MPTYLVELTARPGVTYEVDQAEYDRLVELGLLVGGAPAGPGVFDEAVADLVNDENSATRAAVEAWGGAVDVVYRDVNPDGSGDWTSIAAANTAITDASSSKEYVVWVHPGTYDHTAAPDVIPKAHIKYIGLDEHLVRVTLFQPDNASNATITNNSAFRLRGDAWLENMTIEVANARYCVHDESANAEQDWTHTLRRVRMIHHGNGGARAWRDANPGTHGNGATVPTTAGAYGYGASSGGTLLMEDCLMVAELGPWGVHNNESFTRPNKNILRRCSLVCTGDRLGSGPEAVTLEGLGSGTLDEVLMEDCEWNGVLITEKDTPWLKLTGAQPANHSEYRLTMTGCSPAAFVTSTRGLALMVQSASGAAGSSVRFSGTAAAVLVGEQRYRDGGGGLRGYAYGSLDMSGITAGQGAEAGTVLTNTLGRRLGNRTGAPVTLAVTVDHGAPVNVVFGADHTAQSDATILGLINTALGAAATAALYNPSKGETYPQILDRQRTMMNRQATGIPRWAAVVYDSHLWVRLMATTDPVSSFAGVALEPIPPGAHGRILTGGVLAPSQMFGAATSPVGGSTLLHLGGNYDAGTGLYLSDTTAGAFTTTVGTGRKVGEFVYRTAEGNSYAAFTAEGGFAPPPPLAGPVARYLLDGSTADQVAGGSAGTLNGGATYGAAVVPVAPATQALSLDGVDDYLSVPGQAKLNNPALDLMTVAAWVVADTFAGAGGYRSVVSRHAGWELAVVGNLPELYLVVDLDAGGAVERNARSAAGISAAAAHLLVGTFDGLTTRLYVDGALVASTAGAAAKVSQPVGNLYVGAYNGASEFFDGRIGDVALWDRALSGAEVAALYTDGTT